MRKLKIALGSNDGKNILSGHMGMAKDFYIFDLYEKGDVKFLEKRTNISPPETGNHGIREKRNAVTEILGDTEVFVGRRMSPNFIKIAANTKLQPVVANIDSIPEIMKAITKSFDKIFTLVEQRNQGNFSQEIPKIEVANNTTELK